MSIVKANKWQTTDGRQLNNVLQVVHLDYTTQESKAGTTMADTGLTASITPKFSNSKILVICSAQLGITTGNAAVRARIVRTGPSTVYSTPAAPSGGDASAVNYTTAHYATVGIMQPNSVIRWFDSPGTTSSCTYTLQIGPNQNYTAYLNRYANDWGATWGGVSHLTLMEIAQ